MEDFSSPAVTSVPGAAKTLTALAFSYVDTQSCRLVDWNMPPRQDGLHHPGSDNTLQKSDSFVPEAGVRLDQPLGQLAQPETHDPED